MTTRDEIMAAHAAGKGPTDIGRALGLSRQTVYRHLRAAGIDTGPDELAAREREQLLAEVSHAWAEVASAQARLESVVARALAAGVGARAIGERAGGAHRVTVRAWAERQEGHGGDR